MMLVAAELTYQSLIEIVKNQFSLGVASSVNHIHVTMLMVYIPACMNF
jgi:hypothetical protein